MSSSSRKILSRIGVINSSDKLSPKNSKTKTKKFKDLEKKAMNNIHKKYGIQSKFDYKYIGLIMENLIYNKNSHLVTFFKDYMIWDYVEEFLKRYYRFYESEERVPKFALFYKNYLKFFCSPTFRENFYNEKIHNHDEKKAELFYNDHYRKKKENDSELKDCGLFEETESDEENDSKDSKLFNIEKTIFNETIKKKIEKYSPINTSIPLPESDTRLKPDDSGLLITSSNESSLVDIMTKMNSQPKPKTKDTNKINNNNNNNNNNINKNNNKNTNTNNQNNTRSSKKNEKYVNSNKNNNNGTLNKNNSKLVESSSSYRHSQNNINSNTINRLNSHTIEILLHSQMKKRNISSSLVKRNNNKNIQLKSNHTNNNDFFKNQLYSNNNFNNKNKIISYMGLYKKKSVSKSRNENKLPEEGLKSQPKGSSYLININNNNNNPKTIIKLKKNNLKNITSINNCIWIVIVIIYVN